MPKKGDFTSASRAAEFAQEQHDERSEKAQRVDERNRAPVTTDASRWADNPEALDFPGVDTPTSDPKLLPKDQKNKARTDVAAKAKGEAQRVTPQPARNSSAPETEVSGLFGTDVSLSVEEAFEDVGDKTVELGERALNAARPPESALQEQQEAAAGAASDFEQFGETVASELEETFTDLEDRGFGVDRSDVAAVAQDERRQSEKFGIPKKDATGLAVTTANRFKVGDCTNSL